MIIDHYYPRKRFQLKPDKLLFFYEKQIPHELPNKLMRYKYYLYEWTLQDLRRNLSRTFIKCTPLEFVCLMGIALYKWGFSTFKEASGGYEIRIDKVLDKLISKYGHKASVPEVVDAYLAEYGLNEKPLAKQNKI